jgi:hypothetical protein
MANSTIYLKQILSERFVFTNDILGKKIKYLFDSMDKWLLIITSSNEICGYKVDEDDNEFFENSESSLDALIRYIRLNADLERKKYQNGLEKVGYDGEFNLFLQDTEFYKLLEIIVEENIAKTVSIEEIERKKAKELLAKYPDLLQEKS